MIPAWWSCYLVSEQAIGDVYADHGNASGTKASWSRDVLASYDWLGTRRRQWEAA